MVRDASLRAWAGRAPAMPCVLVAGLHSREWARPLKELATGRPRGLQCSERDDWWRPIGRPTEGMSLSCVLPISLPKRLVRGLPVSAARRACALQGRWQAVNEPRGDCVLSCASPVAVTSGEVSQLLADEAVDHK